MLKNFSNIKFIIFDYEITIQEILIVIIAFLISFFGLIKPLIYHFELKDSDKKEIYELALIPKDNNEYLDYFNTKSGNIIYNSKFKFDKKDFVKFKEMNQYFPSVIKIKEVYTMHTRQVSYPCGDDDTCYRTEVYWTWDYSGQEKKNVNEFTFADIVYKFNQFDFSNHYKTIAASKIIKNHKGFYNEKGDTRYYYKIIKDDFNGTIFIKNEDNIKNVMSNDKKIQIRNELPEKIIEDKTKNSNFKTIIYTIYFIVFILGSGFYVINENKYLE